MMTHRQRELEELVQHQFLSEDVRHFGLRAVTYGNTRSREARTSRAHGR
jgi:hypothetical protein